MHKKSLKNAEFFVLRSIKDIEEFNEKEEFCNIDEILEKLKKMSNIEISLVKEFIDIVSV